MVLRPVQNDDDQSAEPRFSGPPTRVPKPEPREPPRLSLDPAPKQFEWPVTPVVPRVAIPTPPPQPQRRRPWWWRVVRALFHVFLFCLFLVGGFLVGGFLAYLFIVVWPIRALTMH